MKNAIKQRGSILIFISMMITFLMVMGLAVAQVMVAEITLSGDFANSQKAHYARVSGLELSMENNSANSASLTNSAQLLTTPSNPFMNTFLFNTRGQAGASRRESDVVFVKPKISTQFVHTLALASNGSVWTVGNGQYGSFGIGDPEWSYKWIQSPIYNITDISTGFAYTLAIDKNGQLWATGENSMGQLGIGSNEDKNTWTKTSLVGVRDVETWELHGFALKNDGTLWGAGEQYGMGTGSVSGTYTSWTQLPINNVKQISVGTWHSLVLKNDGTVWGAGYGKGLGLNSSSDYASWTQLPITGVTKVVAGYSNSFAIRSDGSLWATGENSWGNLGLGDSTDKLTWLQSSGNVTDFDLGACNAIILKGGTPFMSGCYAAGTSGNISVWTKVPGFADAVSVSAGQDASFIIRSNGWVYGMGSNDYCELGLNDSCTWPGTDIYTFQRSNLNL